MKRALVLLIALIGPFKMTLGRTSCATLVRACDWRGNRFARAARLAAILGGVALLAGCAGQAPALPPAPVVVKLPDCPTPARPVLPGVDGGLPLDSPGNVEALMERDDTLRGYIKGLEAATECFRRRKP